MPLGFAGVYGMRLGRFSGRRQSDPLSEDVIAYNETQKLLKENIQCILKFQHDIIPSTLGKITGCIHVQASSALAEQITHDGIFILMKGIALPRRKILPTGEAYQKRPITSLKFNVTTESENIEAGDEGLYPVLIRLPRTTQELPSPVITPEGNLMYRFQVFISINGKFFKIAETAVKYQGYNLLDDKTTKSSTISLQLQYKRNYLSRKKIFDVDLTVYGGNGFLAEETINFLLAAQNKEKVPLDCKVELVQKVWCQILASSAPTRKTRRLSLKMVVTTVEFAEIINQISPELLWKGMLTVPKLVTPSHKHDFMNSINYVIRVSVSVHGEPDKKEVQELPVYIGTTRGTVEEDDEDGADWVDEQEQGDSEVDSQIEVETPLMTQMSRSMSALFFARSTRRETGIRRAGSVSSLQSYQSSVSSTPSIFKLPPSYSQLSSRRPTLETLPPAYGDVESIDQEEA